MVRQLFIAAMGSLVWGIPAWGAAVPTSINRETSWSINGGANGSFTNNVSGFWGASTAAPAGGSITASGSQVSNIQPLFLSGSGGANLSGSSNLPGAHAQSVYDVFFDLDGPHSYGISGTLTSGVDGGTAVSNFQLSGPGVNDNFTRSANQPDLPFSDAGIIGPGSYHLFANAKTDSNPPIAFSDNASFFFTMDLRTVPEPGSLGLVAVVAAGLVRRTNRRHPVTQAVHPAD